VFEHVESYWWEKRKGCYLHNSGAQGAISRKGRKDPEGYFFCLQIGLLGLPDSLDALGETDIVCLELVEANAGEDGGGVESPHGELAGLGHTLGGEVVDDA